jgi:thiol:disulfide interchange protein DsbD
MTRPRPRARSRQGRLSPLLLLAALALLLLGPAVHSSPSDGGFEEETEPKASFYLSHSALPAGSGGTLLVVLEIPDNFHLQLNEFLELLVSEGAPISVGPMDVPPTGEWHGEPVLKGTTVVRAPFDVAESAATGPATFRASIGYQGCTEGPVYACYPPGEAATELTLEVLAPGGDAQLAHEDVFAAHGGQLTPAGGGGEPPAAPTGGDLASRLRDALARGSLLAFVLVFIGGVLTSFTPCVYPMIPITISFVGGRARSRLEGFILALFFVLGLAIMYSALGILAASTGAVFGTVMQSTAAMAIVAAIFAVMGISMLGAFDIMLPTSLTTKMTSASSGASAKGGGIGTVVGAVLMGMTTGLVASPCVGPVLVVLLTFVAQAGSLLYGFWLLFTFACGLGLLFLVLGTFAGALSALPGAGSWMNAVKHVFGVILIGMAIFYIRHVLGPQTTRLVLGVYLVMVGVFTGAFTPLATAPLKGALFRKALGILIFLSGAVVFLLWLFSLTGMPPVAGPGMPAGPGGLAVVGEHGGVDWRVNDEAALQQAASEGKPAIQDFYADWCVACVELDEKTWIDPRIMEEANRFVTVKMDFTEYDEFSKAATARYAVRGMPTVILYDSQGLEVTRFFGFKGPDEVLAIMKSIP